jgi:hypothetical protein
MSMNLPTFLSARHRFDLWCTLRPVTIPRLDPPQRPSCFQRRFRMSALHDTETIVPPPIRELPRRG